MSKQQQRNQQKRAAKKEAKAAEEAAAVAGAGSRISAPITAADLVQSGESLVLGSCIAHYAPKLPDLLKENGEDATQEKAKEPAEEKESAEAEAERSGAGSPSDAFAELTTRLAWSNPLGLARPLSGEDAIAQWKALSQLEVDGGPRKSKRGSPSMDRRLVLRAEDHGQLVGISAAVPPHFARAWDAPRLLVPVIFCMSTLAGPVADGVPLGPTGDLGAGATSPFEPVSGEVPCGRDCGATCTDAALLCLRADLVHELLGQNFGLRLAYLARSFREAHRCRRPGQLTLLTNRP
ncbi:unnamed protein product [Durusdinium trenchii]|uniref:Uncharacterized protein n=1 Tax=Durusdinium trenchii TaxID=1381693 RepID=A0ABP0IF01_9DINO